MQGANWIALKPNQKVTYIVLGAFDYYLQMAQGSTVIFQSKNGQQIKVKKNIWGPGNLTVSCDCAMEADIGSPPAQGVLTAQCYQYNQMEVVEEIVGQ